MALSKFHYSQAIMELFTCFSATVEKNLIGPKPVYQKKPCKLHLYCCCLPLYENMATCLTRVRTQRRACYRVLAAHNVPLGSYAVTLLTALCFPSGTPARDYLWRIIKCYKKEGPDPHLSLPFGLFLTQAISMFLENHASPIEYTSYVIKKKNQYFKVGELCQGVVRQRHKEVKGTIRGK